MFLLYKKPGLLFSANIIAYKYAGNYGQKPEYCVLRQKEGISANYISARSQIQDLCAISGYAVLPWRCMMTGENRPQSKFSPEWV